MTVILQPDTPVQATLIAPRHKRAALLVAMFGFGVVALDAQITNVALPSIHHSLGGNLAGLQWIVTGYTLMFSALLLFGGSMADRIGSKKAYRSGMLLFVLASAACGLAPSLPFLVGSRVVQGIGAALVTPTSLSLIREAFDNAQERAKAIALWAVGGSVAAAAGPLLGGVLVAVDWRLITHTPRCPGGTELMADQIDQAERARKALDRAQTMVLATVDRESGSRYPSQLARPGSRRSPGRPTQPRDNDK